SAQMKQAESRPSPSPTPGGKYFVGVYKIDSGAAIQAESPASEQQSLSRMVCTGLPSDADKNNQYNAARAHVDAVKVVARMGNPIPFSLEAADKNTILIYSTREHDSLYSKKTGNSVYSDA